MSQQLKATAWVILGLVILLFAFNYTARGNKIDTLNQTVGGQKVTIGGLNKAIDIDKKSDAITDKAVTKNALDQQAIEQRFDRVAEDTKKVETVIKQKYDKVRQQEQAKSPTGKVPEHIEADLQSQEAEEVSVARLEVLRQYFCDIDPSVVVNCVKGVSP